MNNKRRKYVLLRLTTRTATLADSGVGPHEHLEQPEPACVVYHWAATRPRSSTGPTACAARRPRTALTTDYCLRRYDASAEKATHRRPASLTLSTVTGHLPPLAHAAPEYRRDDTQMQTDGQGHTFNGKASWYVYDGLGSVVGEVDPLGNLTSSPQVRRVRGGAREWGDGLHQARVRGGTGASERARDRADLYARQVL